MARMQWAELEPNQRNKEMLLSPYAVIHESCLPKSQTVVRHVAVVKSSYNAWPSMSFLDLLITLLPFAFAVSVGACCTTRPRVESCAAIWFSFSSHRELDLPPRHLQRLMWHLSLDCRFSRSVWPSANPAIPPLAALCPRLASFSGFPLLQLLLPPLRALVGDRRSWLEPNSIQSGTVIVWIVCWASEVTRDLVVPPREG